MKKDLWIRLRKYRFENLVPVSLTDKVKGIFGEDAFTRAFAAKIAKKHGWSTGFAFLAIREYKKFVYLGVISHYDVTPSKIIDIVWHEHQLFTKGYREFCKDVLKKHFDHNPELISFNEQGSMFNAQYQKTLAFYEHEFGVTPPKEIWGIAKFDQRKVKASDEKPERRSSTSYESARDSDVPLFNMFPANSDDVKYAPVPVIFESGKGGDFAGGGATGSWGGDNATTTSAPDTSSCSSSCGGGGD